jgi:uridine kinase
MHSKNAQLTPYFSSLTHTALLQGVTALDPVAQDFDLMYEQTKALKEGKPVQKPIYNHVTGILDPPEEIKSPKVSF